MSCSSRTTLWKTERKNCSVCIMPGVSISKWLYLLNWCQDRWKQKIPVYIAVLPNLWAFRETDAASSKAKSFSPYDQQNNWVQGRNMWILCELAVMVEHREHKYYLHSSRNRKTDWFRSTYLNERIGKDRTAHANKEENSSNLIKKLHFLINQTEKINKKSFEV